MSVQHLSLWDLVQLQGWFSSFLLFSVLSFHWKLSKAFSPLCPVHRPWLWNWDGKLWPFVNTWVDLTMRHSGPPWAGLMEKDRETEQSGAGGTESALMRGWWTPAFSLLCKEGVENVGRLWWGLMHPRWSSHGRRASNCNSEPVLTLDPILVAWELEKRCYPVPEGVGVSDRVHYLGGEPGGSGQKCTLALWLWSHKELIWNPGCAIDLVKLP